jgi:DNA-binding transcriptional LysR family regulator
VQYNTSKVVTIRTNITLAARWLIPRLAEFRSIHPEINLKIISYNDVHGGSSVQADITITYERVDTPITDGVQILSDFSAPVISPQLIEEGEGIAEISSGKWPAISYTDSNCEWRLWASENEIDFKMLRTGDYFCIDETAIEGAIAGLGMVLMPPFIIERELSRGDLVYIPGTKPVHIGGYWLISDTAMLKHARIVRRWLLEYENASTTTP